MSQFRAAVVLCAIMLAPQMGIAQVPKVSITIDGIVKDDHINGTVSGISAIEISRSCIVVYVHTNDWYIHPYAREGVGESYAKIEEDGKWSISTVSREDKADKIAALILNKCGDAPSKVSDISKIANLGFTIKVLVGTADFGKL